MPITKKEFLEMLQPIKVPFTTGKPALADNAHVKNDVMSKYFSNYYHVIGRNKKAQTSAKSIILQISIYPERRNLKKAAFILAQIFEDYDFECLLLNDLTRQTMQSIAWSGDASIFNSHENDTDKRGSEFRVFLDGFETFDSHKVEECKMLMLRSWHALQTANIRLCYFEHFKYTAITVGENLPTPFSIVTPWRNDAAKDIAKLLSFTQTQLSVFEINLKPELESIIAYVNPLLQGIADEFQTKVSNLKKHQIETHGARAAEPEGNSQVKDFLTNILMDQAIYQRFMALHFDDLMSRVHTDTAEMRSLYNVFLLQKKLALRIEQQQSLKPPKDSFHSSAWIEYGKFVLNNLRADSNELNLSYTELDDGFLTPLVLAIKNHPNLIYLNICGNKFTPAAITNLNKAVEANRDAKALAIIQEHYHPELNFTFQLPEIKESHVIPIASEKERKDKTKTVFMEVFGADWEDVKKLFDEAYSKWQLENDLENLRVKSADIVAATILDHIFKNLNGKVSANGEHFTYTDKGLVKTLQVAGHIGKMLDFYRENGSGDCPPEAFIKACCDNVKGAEPIEKTSTFFGAISLPRILINKRHQDVILFDEWLKAINIPEGGFKIAEQKPQSLLRFLFK